MQVGKYTDVLHKLKGLPDQEPLDRRNKINMVKGAIQDHSLPTLCKTYIGIRAEKEELEEKLKKVQIRKDALQEMICEQFQEGNHL